MMAPPNPSWQRRWVGLASAVVVALGCGPPGGSADSSVDLGVVDSRIGLDHDLSDLAVVSDLHSVDLRPVPDLHYPLCHDRSCLLNGRRCTAPDVCLVPAGLGGLIVPTCLRPCKSGADCLNGMHCVWLRWDVRGMERYCVSNDYPPLCTGELGHCSSAPGCMGNELCMDFNADNSPACGVECIPCKAGCDFMTCK